ncbi:MAG: alcohol dehydrogenase, partial [Acidimicrobium sp.]
MARQCTRQGCVHSATVTLTYQYARSSVWLDDLSPERDPHSYDL